MQLAILLISLLFALPNQQETEIVVSTIWYPSLRNSTELQCKIVRSIGKGRLPVRQLLILDAQSGKTMHVFETIDAPVAMFPLQDAGGSLVAVWTGGTGYRIQVIVYEGGRVKEALKVDSATFPQFVDLDSDGCLEIVVTSRLTQVSTDTGVHKAPAEYSVYKWSDGRYRAATKLVPDDLSACYSHLSNR